MDNIVTTRKYSSEMFYNPELQARLQATMKVQRRRRELPLQAGHGHGQIGQIQCLLSSFSLGGPMPAAISAVLKALLNLFA